MKDYKQLYKQTQRKMKEFIKRWDGIKLSSNDLFTEELKQIVEIENEDERVRKEIIETFKILGDGKIPVDINYADIFTWLEKQGEHHIACSEEQMRVLDEVLNFAANHENPYWNDYIFGTLNSLIRQLKKLEKQGEQETLCDKCRKEHPSHSCQDITALGRCALEKQDEQKQKQYDIDILEKHITKDSISELAHTVIVRNGWEIVDAKEQKTVWSEKQGEEKIADKAESMEHGYITTNSEFFQWIYDRLKYVYNENPNVDYMLSLKERIEDMQKFADKIEPKFKVGDWIVDKFGFTQQVLDFRGGIYTCTYNSFTTDSESNYHLWTIQDAKDGDVLVASDESVFIYSGSTNTYAQFYIALSKYGDFNTKGGNWEDKNFVKPATKEQRDSLMKAMADAGWEFDFEKKELKKIPNALEECEIEHIEHGKYYYCIKDYYSGGNKRVSKGEVIQALRGMSMMALGVKANEYFIPVKCIIGDSCAWSEEDENAIKVLMNIIRKSEMIDSIIYTDSLKEKLYDWLKFIRPKNMWISVDKEVYVKEPVLAQKIDKSDPFKGYVVCCDHTLVPNVYERYMLLSNIISQNTWKPSKEQIKKQIIALRWVLNNIPYNTHKEEISGLLEQLNKLKEE